MKKKVKEWLYLKHTERRFVLSVRLLVSIRCASSGGDGNFTITKAYSGFYFLAAKDRIYPCILLYSDGRKSKEFKSNLSSNLDLMRDGDPASVYPIHFTELLRELKVVFCGGKQKSCRNFGTTPIITSIKPKLCLKVLKSSLSY